MLASCRAAETDSEGNLQQFVGHQRDVRRLERRVCAGGAHRHAHVGRGQRRRVVDSVANHHNRSVLLERLYDDNLVVGEKLRVRLVDADVTRQRFGTCVVVARQHHDPLNAVAPQHLDCVARRFTRAIGERDDAHRTSLPRDEHCRAARGRERVELRMNRGVAETALLDKPVVADKGRLSVNDRLGPSARDRLELLRIRKRDSRLDGPGEDRAADGVLRSRFEARGNLQNLVDGCAVQTE